MSIYMQRTILKKEHTSWGTTKQPIVLLLGLATEQLPQLKVEIILKSIWVQLHYDVGLLQRRHHLPIA